MKQKYIKNPSIDFDLRQLEIFCKVVDLKSFSKAAKAVFLAQASVSERIANLESMVRTKLLDRLGRQVVPTRAGKLLYKHATELLNMKRRACLEMENFLGIKKGEIHVGASTIPGEYILPKSIGLFNEKYPSISIVMAIADTDEIERRILHGDFDLGIVGSKSSHKNLTFHALWNDELVLTIPRNHRWSKKKEINIKELSNEPFILRETGSGTLKIIEEYLGPSASKTIDSLRVVARFGSSTAVKEGIKAGLGVSILSSRAIEAELETGSLNTLQIKGLSLLRKFYLIMDKRRTVSPICRAMLDFLMDSSRES
ncbi:MAG: LysR family transcriptional regulator [Deltaproteobacteria bacterium]|nr:LysR family transcriptional regulator [Deltaproteobacteria bacterium]MBW2662514.1 LysR family transcriptional regulator [Deltaproteobacteria bacterium]